MSSVLEVGPAVDEAGLLPDGYEDLAPMLGWALETEDQRHAKRLASSIEDTRRLYDAMAPRMEGVMQYLQGFPFAESLDAAHHRLYLLALAFVEVALPIELGWKGTRNEGSYPTTRLQRPHRP